MGIKTSTIKLPHDKTNKVAVCPAKTQISLGICRVWSVFADAQDDLSLRWAHTHFVSFVMQQLSFVCPIFTTFMVNPPESIFKIFELSVYHKIQNLDTPKIAVTD